MSTTSEGNLLSERFYPAFAPLPVPLTQHLITLEARQQHTRTEESLCSTVLARVQRARQSVYEYMDDFVQMEAQIPRRGRGLSFPGEGWLLDELQGNTPRHIRPARITLDKWQQRGLLLRERERGPFDLDSVAALLIARIVEKEHERGWLPQKIEDDVPRWWCYGRATPTSPVVSVPVPLPDTLPPMLLWTKWLGAAWNKEWHLREGVACRWSPTIPTREDLEVYST